MSKPISARRVIITSFVVDVSDVALNVAVMVVTGSVVMLAESLQGAADLLTSTLLLVGVRRAARRANRDFHFGYGRELFFWVLMAGIAMLVLTGTLSVYVGVQRLLEPAPVAHVWLTYVALGAGAASNGYALALSIQRLRGKHPGPRLWQRVRHSSLVETKATFVLDLMGTAASVIGLVALGWYGVTGNGRLDGVGSILIGVTVAVLAVGLIVGAKDLLVGRSAGGDIDALIRQAALEVKGVKRVLDLRTMYLGSERLLVNVEVNLAGGLETRQIEKLIDEIKQNIKRQAPIVGHIQVELETPVIREP
ncbi:MAG TPA: cation diffusion facilitator family transporter [Candidatus Saccharimonas sp.]|nr:cation diffusion facilitator family transporter [Candidatus Saccharimonas sp.]